MSTKSKSQLQEDLAKLKQTKAKLIAAKESTPDKFTEKHQTKLDDVTEKIFDLEEQLELMPDDEAAPEAPEPPAYSPAPGTEKLVHLAIVRGRRFNPRTGKEESQPYTQMFTPGEFQLFKANAHLLGYSVLKVLHDPTGQAESLVVN